MSNYLKDKTQEEIEIFKKDTVLKYTDTDSMMGKYEYIYLITNIYEEVYKEKLDGTDFGQFHIDFVMTNPKLVNVFAKRAIFLNKKEYAMILQGYNPETKEFEYEEKIAFKGVPLHRIEYLAKQTFPNEEFPLYALFSSNKEDYKVDVVGEEGFKVSYSNKGSLAISVHSSIKKVNTKQYENKQWMNKVSRQECVVEKFTLEAIMKTHQLEIGSDFDIVYGCYRYEYGTLLLFSHGPCAKMTRKIVTRSTFFYEDDLDKSLKNE